MHLEVFRGMSIQVRSPLNNLSAIVGRYLSDQHLGSVLRGAAMAFIIRGGAAAAGYLCHIILARWLGAFEFGIYTFAIAWLMLLSMPATLGLPTATIRFVSQYLVAEKWPELRGLLRMGWIVTLVAGIAFSAVSIGIVYVFIDGMEEYYLWPLTIALAAIPLGALVKLNSEAARAFGWVGLAYVPSQLAYPILLIIASFALIQFQVEASATAMVLATISVFLVVLIWQEVILRRRLDDRFFRDKARYETKLWMGVSVPLMLAGAFSIIMTQTDVIMIGVFLDPQQVAYYSAAAKTAIVVTLVFQSIITLAVPKIGELHARDSRDELQRLLSSLIHWIFWPSLVAALTLVLFGHWILRLFGPGFETAYLPLVILVIGQTIHAAVGPVLGLLSMTGHQKLCAQVFAVSAATNVILNACLIPVAGLTGAAIATATSLVLWNLWLLVVVIRKVGVNPSLLAPALVH
jgi:O-antigen/teichoic acid export membrane protein